MPAATGNIPDDYPDDYFDCRLDRHSWDSPRGRTIPLNARPTVRCFPRYRVCSRCASWWTSGYSAAGDLIYTRRLYPENVDRDAAPYLLRGVGGPAGRPRNAEWRRGYVLRADVKLYDPDLDPDFF